MAPQVFRCCWGPVPAEIVGRSIGTAERREQAAPHEAGLFRYRHRQRDVSLPHSNVGRTAIHHEHRDKFRIKPVKLSEPWSKPIRPKSYVGSDPQDPARLIAPILQQALGGRQPGYDLANSLV